MYIILGNCMEEGMGTGTVLGIRYSGSVGKVRGLGEERIIHVGHLRDSPETWDGTGSWDNIECPWLRLKKMGIKRLKWPHLVPRQDLQWRKGHASPTIQTSIQNVPCLQDMLG